MIQISEDALRDGGERAHDLFLLNRLRGPVEVAASFEAVYDALGIDAGMRTELERALRELVPVKGVPAFEATTVVSMLAGVLVGLLIADSSSLPRSSTSRSGPPPDRHWRPFIRSGGCLARPAVGSFTTCPGWTRLNA